MDPLLSRDTQTGIFPRINVWLSQIWMLIIRPIVKGFLRRTTGLCELQRICYGTSSPGAERCLQVENSILQSRSAVIKKIRSTLILNCDRSGLSKFKLEGRFAKELSDEDEAQIIAYAVDAICMDKLVKASIHKEFVFSLRVCLTQLFYYKKVSEEALSLAAVPFDRKNPEHSILLIKLWYNLNPERTKDSKKDLDEAIKSRISYDSMTVDWTAIGFQGSDPATDFRGMGLLGLRQLVYFTENFSDSSQNVFMESSHPSQGFPFAITGINLTNLAVNLMLEGHLEPHFFNLASHHYWIDDLHKVYSYLFVAFSAFWLKEKPESVMQFQFIREKFIHYLLEHLSDKSSSLINWTCPIVESI